MDGAWHLVITDGQGMRVVCGALTRGASIVVRPRAPRPLPYCAACSEGRRAGGRHKYGAQADYRDGIRFASKAEARRYDELKALERAGQIRDLRLQPRYPLHVGRALIGHYVGDFEYVTIEEGVGLRIHTEDVKGLRTPLYTWKRKHFEAQYGRAVVEVVGRRVGSSRRRVS